MATRGRVTPVESHRKHTGPKYLFGHIRLKSAKSSFDRNIATRSLYAPLLGKHPTPLSAGTYCIIHASPRPCLRSALGKAPSGLRHGMRSRRGSYTSPSRGHIAPVLAPV